MFERFTDRARRVMALANEEAQRFNHEVIEPEHILLGLVKEGSGVGFQCLRDLGLGRLLNARAAVEKRIKVGENMVTMGKLPRSPKATHVVEGAIAAARQLQSDAVGTEHLLLALSRQTDQPDSVAAAVLSEFKITADAVMAQILAKLDRPGDDADFSASARPEDPDSSLLILLSRASKLPEALGISGGVTLWELFELAACLSRAKGQRAMGTLDLLRAISLTDQSRGAQLLDRLSGGVEARQRLILADGTDESEVQRFFDWTVTIKLWELLKRARAEALQLPLRSDHIVIASAGLEDAAARLALKEAGFDLSAIILAAASV